MKLYITIILLLSLLSVQSKFCSKYTSADSLWLASDLDEITPQPRDCGALSCETYVWGNWWTKIYSSHLTCLGWFGPLSAYGPLSDIGPAVLGKNTKYFGDDMQKMIRESNIGPLSNVGPLGDKPFFDTMIHGINDFTMHMQGLGIWSVLGPLGPLGPLGHLGPLGPLGIHGLEQNADGDYLDQHGHVKRNIDMKWEGSTHQNWPLFETYSLERAQQLSKQGSLDTSFSILNLSGRQTFNLQSEGNHYVTVIAVPTAQSDSALAIDVYAHEVGQSYQDAKIRTSSSYFTNWIQMEIPTETEFAITVRGSTFPFNLYVVGSTPFMNRKQHIQYTGDYIQQY